MQIAEDTTLLNATQENLPNGFQLGFQLTQNGEGSFSDGQACLTLPNHEQFLFDIEVKMLRRKENLYLLLEKWERDSPHPPLLICPPLSPKMADFCEKNGIHFIDAAGNARINITGLYLYIAGKKAVNLLYNDDSRPHRISEGTLKLLFVLLSEPETINENYRTLANLAGISLGMVSKAFDSLEAQRYYRKSSHGRRLIQPEQLMTLWLREYGNVLRPKLKSIALEPVTDWPQLPLSPQEYWGGEAGASFLTKGYLQPEIVILFTHQPLLQRRKELGLYPAPNGQIRLTRAFWGEVLQLNTRAKAMLCAAELLASQDDRNLEAARIINDRYLGIKNSTLFGN